jgi:hypothetical protein
MAEIKVLKGIRWQQSWLFWRCHLIRIFFAIKDPLSEHLVLLLDFDINLHRRLVSEVSLEYCGLFNPLSLCWNELKSS